MSGVFPIKTPVEREGSRGARLVDIDEPIADEVFEALSSGTTRQIFRHLHESPQTATDLAERTDTSLQNVQYHLEKLSNVDLIEVADVWYSERGTEMKVYAPTDDALVLFAGRDEGGTIRSLLKRVAAVIAFLAPASAATWWVTRTLVGRPAGQAGGGDGGEVFVSADGGAAAPTAMETAATAATDPAFVAGAAFFLGGVFVLAVVVAAWVHRQRS
ncbi:MAG: ArsR/SmtB family transcription factor [Salinirussus sp.]